MDAPEEAGGDAVFEFMARMVAGGMVGSIRPETCGDVDTLIASLEPLPAENIADLTGAILSLARVGERDRDGDDGEEGSGGPPICRP